MVRRSYHFYFRLLVLACVENAFKTNIVQSYFYGGW